MKDKNTKVEREKNHWKKKRERARDWNTEREKWGKTGTKDSQQVWNLRGDS